MSDPKHPRIGVGILIQNEQGEVLLGLRHGSHGAETWSFPGGHLEWGETIFACARREVQEETGLVIEPIDVVSVCDDHDWLEDGKHYITVGVLATYTGGEPKVMEPRKCREWRWFARHDVPEHLFGPTKRTLENAPAKHTYKETSTD